jgi:hypothetical protein
MGSLGKYFVPKNALVTAISTTATATILKTATSIQEMPVVKEVEETHFIDCNLVAACEVIP